MKDRPQGTGCLGYEIDGPNGRDYDCEYRPPFACDDCMFCDINIDPATGEYTGEGKDPRIEYPEVD